MKTTIIEGIWSPFLGFSSKIQWDLVKIELVCYYWVVGAPVVGDPTYFRFSNGLGVLDF